MSGDVQASVPQVSLVTPDAVPTSETKAITSADSKKAAEPLSKNPKWSGKYTSLFFIFLLGTPVFSYLLCWHEQLRSAWAVSFIFMIGFILVVGKGVSGYFDAVFIDSRNKMSLSRFQTAAWTAIVLSAFLTAGFWNVIHRFPTPLDIMLPQELWMLMGISLTSLVGSPLIKSAKMEGDHRPEELQATTDQLAQRGIPEEAVIPKGTLTTNSDPKYARWSDMFSGEEVGDSSQLDLGKVQMFYFTIVVLVTYTAALWQMFSIDPSEGIKEFPAFSQGMLALLAISHTAYLANKAVPHSKK